MLNSPEQTAYEYCKAAVEKTKLPTYRFILLAILGGAFIALGGFVTVIVVGGSPTLLAANPGLAKFISGALFPVGLIIITMAGADLFTSNCAGMTIAGLQKEVKVSTILKIWGLSYLFNFVGAQFIAYTMSANLGYFDMEPWRGYLHSMAEAKVNLGFHDAFWRGVGANWLVCLGVWMGFASKDVVGKIIGLWIPTMLFVALGYEHSIANMFFVPAAIYSGADIGWMQFITDNLIAVTLGNIVGGALLVGGVYWLIYMKKGKEGV